MIAKLVHLALGHRWFVLLLAAAACIAGVAALLKLPVDAFPDVSPNMVQVFAELEGMAAEEVEQLVTRPVEVAMRGIPGVKRIRSLSSQGLSTVNVYFEDDIETYRARQLVTERLKLAEEGIPSGVEMPHGLEMGPVASGMGKILAYYFDAGDMDIADVRTLQDWVVKRDIETVPGVAKVVSQGGYVRQYEVIVHPDRLMAYGLRVQDVIEAVESNNANVGAGLVKRGDEELVVRSLGRLRTIRDIEQIVVRTIEGRPVFVRDLATVRFGNAQRRGVAILDGEKEVVVGGVYKLFRANSFNVIRELRQRIEEVNQALPEGVRLVTYYDQSELVANSIQTVRGALLMGLILVCGVAFLFLGNIRNVVILVLSMPFAVLFASLCMHRYGIAGDLISFGGVAIALGMIIDSSIIMVERIQASFSDPSAGSDLIETIRKAAAEVGKPIVFAVSVIVIVFLPVFTLGEVEGKMFRPLAFAVSTTLVGALAYALLVAPVLCCLIHRKAARSGARGTGRLFSILLNAYEAVLNRVLRRAAAVILVIAVLTAAGIFLFFRIGREFVPTLQEGTVQCLGYMNPNISLDQIKETASEISKDVLRVPEVAHIVADIGYGEVGPHVHHTNFACMTVTLDPRREWPPGMTQETLTARINKGITHNLGVDISFSQPVNHELDGLVSGVGAAVAAKVFGHDTGVLQEIAGQIEHVLADIPGVADLRIEQMAGQTQMKIDLNGNRLARYGLNRHEVQSLVHEAMTGRQVGQIFEGEKAFRIQLRLGESYRDSVKSIEEIPVPLPSEGYVPLGDLATIRIETGLRQISREDTRRYTSVQCNVRERDVGGFVAEAQKKVAEAVALPPGYRIDWGGQFELQEAANKRLSIVIPVTLFLVVIMLYALFNSVKNVALILLNIPLALVGGVFALSVTGGNISIPSSIGFIALFGIALTGGLVLISRFEHLRKEGSGVREAVIEGSKSKLRPVLMTALTTALGLLPLALATGIGSEVQRPLAIVVIGGLASSTLLTLIVLPTLYLRFTKGGGQETP